VWEEEVYREFLLLLEIVPISRDKPSWNYRHDIRGLFSVKSNYDFLAPLLLPTSYLPHSLGGVVHKVWDNWAPSKVVVFSWQTLLSRIATRANLATRGVLLEAGNVSCAVCGRGRNPKTICFSCAPWLGLFGLRCISGLVWWRFFRKILSLISKAFFLRLRVVRDL
jgi:hypothetical protein